MHSSIDWASTRISTELSFTKPGRHVGDLRLKHSDNRQPLGYVPIPIGVLTGADGPTVLLTAGVHGDEFEGPIALLKLVRSLDVDALRGRIIVLPALNAPAIRSASRVSPLDGGNLNRAFPGNADGGPTAMLAHLIEEVLLPVCDAAIDLHSGGKAAWFTPCSMAGRLADGSLSQANLALAEAFGAPLVWAMGALNENRSVNAAASRKGITMIAAELGGGGAVSLGPLAVAERGVLNCLRHLGLLEPEAEAFATRRIEVNHAEQSVHAPVSGLFEPRFVPGEEVRAGQSVGAIYSIEEPERPAVEIDFGCSGVALCRTHRGLVERGELLVTVGIDANV